MLPYVRKLYARTGEEAIKKIVIKSMTDEIFTRNFLLRINKKMINEIKIIIRLQIKGKYY